MTETLERQELELLLASRHLRGKRVREALRFLCEQHWAAEPATQYDLAQNLYGNVDNLVGARNVVKNLRQKLELHYATEGRENPLHLTIPSGGYEITFSNPEESFEVNAIAASTTGEEPTTVGPQGLVEPSTPVEQPEPQGKSIPGALPPGCPLDKHENTTAHSWRLPAGLLAALVVFSILIIVIVTMQGFSKGRRSPADSLTVDGDKVIGQTMIEPDLWPETLPANVFKTLELDPHSANRFVVLYGGLESKSSPPAELTPHVAFLSPSGEILRTINLLEEFNPYRQTHDDRFFRFSICQTLDYDFDGHQDLLVSIKHLYYPSMVYAISGRKREISGAFANSGTIQGVIPCEPVPGSSGRTVIGVAINNPMGEQIALFTVPLSGRFVSPDLDSDQFERHYGYRPTGLLRLSSELWSLEPGNLLSLKDVDHSLSFDPSNVALSSDPWFTNDRESMRAFNTIREFYAKVITARRYIKEGMIEEGQVIYDSAMELALDEPLRLYVMLDAARTLKTADKAEAALAWLPENPEKLFHPRRPMLLRGHLLTILGQYEDAKQAFIDTNHVEYSSEGYVQACILSGMTSGSLQMEIAENYAIKSNLAATAAWLQIPALLCGDRDDASSNQQMFPVEPGEADALDDRIRYMEESVIWDAFVALEAGITSPVWPTEQHEPMEREDLFFLKLDALEAFRQYVTEGAAQALPHLESSYRDLKGASQRDSEAIIPFVLIAYSCGFAADEAGCPDLARKALSDAAQRYPFGSKYQQAMNILEKHP